MQGSLALVPPDDFTAMLLIDLVNFSNSSPQNSLFWPKKKLSPRWVWNGSPPSPSFNLGAKVQYTCILENQERIMEQREKRPVYLLWYVNFTKFIFRQIKCFKLIRSWFPERFANVYSVSVGKGTLCSVGVSPIQNDTESESITPYSFKIYKKKKWSSRNS